MSLNELWMLNVVVRVKNETSCEPGSRADDVIVRALYEPSVAYIIAYNCYFTPHRPDPL